MVICSKGPAVFLEPSKAFDYAAYHHGYVVRMFGQDDAVETVGEGVDHAPETRDLEGYSG
jgi:hypothetical protein